MWHTAALLYETMEVIDCKIQMLKRIIGTFKLLEFGSAQYD